MKNSFWGFSKKVNLSYQEFGHLKNSLISIRIFFEKIAIFIENVSVIKPYLAGAFLGLTPSKFAPGSWIFTVLFSEFFVELNAVS